MINLLQIRKNIIFPGVLLLISLIAISITGDSGDFAITVLSFLAIFSILFDQPVSQHTNTELFNARTLPAVVAGAALIITGYLVFESAVFTRTLPFIFLLVLWFTEAGQDVVLKNWKPLLILFLLAIPDRALITPLFYPFLKLFGWDAMTYPTAYFTAYLTTITGLPAVVDGLDVVMEYATVTIWEGCDAVRNMGFLLRLSIILILTIPIKTSRWFGLIIVAVLLGFVVNIFRVSLLSYLANYGNLTAFDYWHEGDGSKVFNLIAIILFSVYGYFQVSSNTVSD